ncbi:hypothetical protein DS509_25250, partial [Salmonella enterica subsp. diarizonae]|nr:hypothetical protein [Salmonella enterica subsp. diarizonae]
DMNPAMPHPVTANEPVSGRLSLKMSQNVVNVAERVPPVIFGDRKDPDKGTWWCTDGSTGSTG